MTSVVGSRATANVDSAPHDRVETHGTAVPATIDPLPGLLASPLRNSTIAAGVLLMVKAYGVGHFSLTTTAALITTAPVTAVLGTIASYAYVLWPVLAVGLCWWVLTSASTTAHRLLGVVVMLLAGLLSPFVYLLPVASAGAAFYRLAMRIEARRGEASGNLRRQLLPVFVLLSVVTFLVVTLDKPWAPAEVLVLEQPVLVKPHGNVRDQYPIVYVLDGQGSTVSAMVADTRYVLHIPTDQVKGRLTCHAAGQLAGHEPVLSWLKRESYDSPNLLCSRLTTHLRDGTVTP